MEHITKREEGFMKDLTRKLVVRHALTNDKLEINLMDVLFKRFRRTRKKT